MSRELFKSLTYRDNKVYTRQCSSNVNPKNFYNEENKHFTSVYNELGKEEFEKWFLIHILNGSVEVLNGSNNTLRKLNYFANLLCNDNKYKTLRDKSDNAFECMLSAEKNDKGNAYNEYESIKKEVDKYVCSFYDTHNLKYKNLVRER